MSFKNLEEARAKRAAKEKATACKGKRSLKRKIHTLESEVKAQAVSSKKLADSLVSKNKVARMSEVNTTKTSGAPFRAPVARMY